MMFFFKQINGSDINTDSVIFDKVKNSQIIKKTKNILYAPTFRDIDRNTILNAKFDLQRLNNFLKKFSAIFLIKFHPIIKLEKNLQKYSNIFFVSPNTDIYPLLKYVDILVTDYSSIYFDFLLLDKPIIFFPYDFEKYISKDRELYFNYNDFTPGMKANNFKELLKKIELTLTNKNDEYKEFRKRIKNLVFKYEDGNSSERLLKKLTTKIV